MDANWAMDATMLIDPMIGAVRSGSDNNKLVDNLMNRNYIRTKKVEQVFRALDRAAYMTPESYNHAYKNRAWRSGPLHLSSPCIYSEVMEALELGEGLSFLNIGSGTGYLSSLVGLILSSQGINHGVEVHPEVYEYALTKLAKLLENSPVAVDFDFCQPTFFNGNGLCLVTQSGYDRVYCGAACPTEYYAYFRKLIKVGGILVMPLNGTLVQVRRVTENKWVSRSLLRVVYAPLRVPTREEAAKFLRLDAQRSPQLVLSRGAVPAALPAGVMSRQPEHMCRSTRSGSDRLCRCIWASDCPLHGTDETEVEITVLSAPGKPGGPLKVTDLTKNGCKLAWKKPEDNGGKPITGYVVEKLNKATGIWMPVGKTNDTEMEVKGLQEGEEYEFRVMAVNDVVESEPLKTGASIIAKNPYDIPGIPSIPTVVDWDVDRVDLKWEAPKSTGGAPITGYIIEKKEKYGHYQEALVTNMPECKARVQDLNEGNKYQFRVKAVNKAGPGEPGEPTQPHVAKARFSKPLINREKMVAIRVRAGATLKLDVDIKGELPPTKTWTFANKVVGNGPGIKLENEDYNTKLQIFESSWKNSGVCTLKAENESGVDEATVEITVLDKPGKPEGPLEVSGVHADHAQLSWKKPKHTEGRPLSAYLVEKMDTITGKWTPAGTIDTDVTEATVTGLDSGHTYQFRVKALNEEGESEPLDTDHVTLAKNPYDVPSPPGLPDIVDYDENSVKLRWEPSIWDNGAPITGYIIECMDRDGGEFIKVIEVQGNIFQSMVPKLKEGNQYQFRVRAVNKAGQSKPLENTNWHTAKPRFLKPRIDCTNLNLITVKAGLPVSLDVKVFGEPPATVTWFFKDEELKDRENLKIINIDYNTKFLIRKTTCANSGKYIIKAKNEVGEDEADVEIVVVGKPSKPKVPLEVSDVTKNGCTLTWQKPEYDGGSPIEYYEIEKLDPLTGTWSPCGTEKDCKANVTGLQEGKPYKFRVKALNKEGESEELETEKSIIVKNPYDEPGKPGRPEPRNWDEDFVDLEWTPPKQDGGAPITGYIIQVKEKGDRTWQECTSGDRPTAHNIDVQEGHEYQFRVIALNKAGQSEPSEPSKSVIAKPSFLAPEINRKNLQSRKVKVGETLKLEADVKEEPEPTIIWTLNGETLESQDRIKIENVDYHTSCVLQKITRADTGKYVVTAKNDSGTDTVEIEITVVGKPAKPKGPLKLAEFQAEEELEFGAAV